MSFRCIFTVIALSCTTFGRSQNLIPDSSFTSTDSTGRNAYWTIPIGKPGAFCSPSNWDTLRKNKTLFSPDSTRTDFLRYYPAQPQNAANTVRHSSIVLCKLSETMVKDSIYEIRMWVYPPTLLEISSIQVYFSSNQLIKTEKIQNEKRVDLVRIDGRKLVNNVVSIRKKYEDEAGTFHGNWIVGFENKWVCVAGTYKAAGDEKYFYIANLFPFEYTVYNGEVRKNKLVPDQENNPRNAPFPEQALCFLIDDVSIRRKSN